MSQTLKPLYAGSSALTVTHLASLASDTSLIAGWQSDVQDNTSGLYDDVWVSGTLLTGTSPTVSTSIEIWLWGSLDDTPTYPDTVSGTEGTCAITSRNVLFAGAFKQIQVITVDATSNRSYPFGFWAAQYFGGNMPKKWGYYIVQNTGVALKSSGQVVNVTGFQNQLV